MTPALIDEIITLKTVSRLSPAEIARRCGLQIAEVGDVLIDAGILIMPPASKALREESLRDIRKYWRNSAPPAPPTSHGDYIIENDHLAHCLRVVRALGGRGFPFLTFDGASSA